MSAKKGGKMIITPRRIEIFKAIVEEFILTAEPVGSKTLMLKYHLPYSSATIRNDMAILEELGFIEKTHTSSGRIPSSRGYKFYCEHLLEQKIDNKAKNALSNIFSNRMISIEDAIRESCEIIAEMTNLTSGILGPDARKSTLEHIKLFQIDDHHAVCVLITNTGHSESRNFQFRSKVSLSDIETCLDILNQHLRGSYVSELYHKLEEIRPLLSKYVQRHEILFSVFAQAFIKFASDNIYFSKKNNIMIQPEYGDIENLKKLLFTLEDKIVWKNLRENNLELALTTHSGAQMVWLDDLAVVSNSIKINGQEEAKIMVVGPSRMEYDRILGLLNYIGSEIDKLYGGDNDE